MLFDTLELSKALQPSFTPEQAEALVHALGKASSDQLASKADIVELKSEVAAVRSEIAAVRSEMQTLEANLTGMITAQISLLRAETLKWIVSALAFNFIGTAGLIITLTKVFGK